MSRDGADGAPPMRKRVRAARLTLAHASGLRYALGDRRGPPLSRPSARALSVIRVPSTAPALVPPNVERAEAFRARDTGHGTSRPAAFYVPSGHRGRAGASRAEAPSSPRRPGRATESALARRSIRHRSVRLARRKERLLTFPFFRIFVDAHYDANERLTRMRSAFFHKQRLRRGRLRVRPRGRVARVLRRRR